LEQWLLTGEVHKQLSKHSEIFTALVMWHLSQQPKYSSRMTIMHCSITSIIKYAEWHISHSCTDFSSYCWVPESHNTAFRGVLSVWDHCGSIKECHKEIV
jgi:hypothetical protein